MFIFCEFKKLRIFFLFTFDESKVKLPFNHFVIGRVLEKNAKNIFYKNKGKIFEPQIDSWSHFE